MVNKLKTNQAKSVREKQRDIHKKMDSQIDKDTYRDIKRDRQIMNERRRRDKVFEVSPVFEFDIPGEKRVG